MTDADVHGPVDYLVVELDLDRADGSVADELFELVKAGTIRIYDIAVVARDDDGTVRGLDLSDAGLTVFEGAGSGLLGQEDFDELANALEPGRAAAVLVYENTWAIPFVAAARRIGAEVVASARIPADVLIEALDAD